MTPKETLDPEIESRCRICNEPEHIPNEKGWHDRKHFHAFVHKKLTTETLAQEITAVRYKKALEKIRSLDGGYIYAQAAGANHSAFRISSDALAFTQEDAENKAEAVLKLFESGQILIDTLREMRAAADKEERDSAIAEFQNDLQACKKAGL